MHSRFIPPILFAASVCAPVLLDYPDKAICLLAPSAAGESFKVLMPTLATPLSHQMDVPFVSGNKPGAFYVISPMDLVRSPPDGYTLADDNVV